MIDKDATNSIKETWANEGSPKQIKTKKARNAMGADAQLRQFIILDRLPKQIFDRLEKYGYRYIDGEWLKK